MSVLVESAESPSPKIPDFQDRPDGECIYGRSYKCINNTAQIHVDSNSLFAPNESPRELPADGAETFNVAAGISQSHCTALLARLGVEISMGIHQSKLAAEELGSSSVTQDEGSGAEVPDGNGDREGGEPVLRRREDECPPEDKSFWGIDNDNGDIKSTVVARNEGREEGKEGVG
ncbi:hypothetical protein K439DRAFT_1625037 [Ramaria rubella]|nr:hypothetical protein K439DRAFT_1625037 [Ramaria rubella]